MVHWTSWLDTVTFDPIMTLFGAAAEQCPSQILREYAHAAHKSTLFSLKNDSFLTLKWLFRPDQFKVALDDLIHLFEVKNDCFWPLFDHFWGQKWLSCEPTFKVQECTFYIREGCFCTRSWEGPESHNTVFLPSRTPGPSSDPFLTTFCTFKNPLN